MHEGAALKNVVVRERAQVRIVLDVVEEPSFDTERDVVLIGRPAPDAIAVANEAMKDEAVAAGMGQPAGQRREVTTDVVTVGHPRIEVDGQALHDGVIRHEEGGFPVPPFPGPLDVAVGEAAPPTRDAVGCRERAGVSAALAGAKRFGLEPLGGKSEPCIAGHRDAVRVVEGAAWRPPGPAVRTVGRANLVAAEDVRADREAPRADIAAPQRGGNARLSAGAHRAFPMSLSLDTLEVVPENDIDRAGDGLRPMNGDSARAENLDSLDGRYGQRIKVDIRIGNSSAVNQERCAETAELERAVQAEVVELVPACQEVPQVTHAGKVDVFPVDDRDGPQIARGHA